MKAGTREILIGYEKELSKELEDILAYWLQHAYDKHNACFAGRIDEAGFVQADAPKGSVLNSRILWTFSSAFLFSRKAEYLQAAKHTCEYINRCFIDGEFGGVYWTVDRKGNPLDTKKQLYAQAFALYGFSAYYLASGDENAKKTAIELFTLIERYGFDEKHKGYIDAFNRGWKEMGDIRLSAKDANEKKTMNTHLHILEAYSLLYSFWKDEVVKNKIEYLLANFSDHIVNVKDWHLDLFFDEQWNRKSNIISFGHDIEASWLLYEAAETLHDDKLINATKSLALKIADASSEGLDEDGGLWYECDRDNHHLVKEKHWWVQAEAMVGFFNAWQLSNDDSLLERSIRSWNYTKSKIRDEKLGEWYWGRDANGAVMHAQDKVGIWKCPYHNSRACMEIAKRIRILLNPGN